MKTVFDFGKIDGYGNGRKTCKVEIEMELTDDNIFTASGSVWNSRGTDIIMGGQCLDDLCKYFYDNSKFLRIYWWWKKWHLNDMHAGTEKQELALKDFERDYKAQRKYLESIGLLYDNGYEYGTKWLKRHIPYDIQERMREFIKRNEEKKNG